MTEMPRLNGYEFLGSLGEGGMARVYQARQLSLDRIVAVKCLRQDRFDEEALRRLSLEASTLARLQHPGIVAVHDVIFDDRGVFMIMEELAGGSLRERMNRPMEPRQVLRTVIHVARALGHAHARGLVHRDLKPENILFREDETPVITDFGIVYHADTRPSRRLTQAGTILGTPTYLSPEQIEGKTASARSDLYALGVLLQEMLTGRPPFHGESTNAILYGHLGRPPPPLPEKFSALQPVLDQLLAKEPNKRFGTVDAFLKALRNVLEQHPDLLNRIVDGPSLSVSDRLHVLGFESTGGLTTRVLTTAPLSIRSRPWLPVAAGAGLLLVALGVAHFIFDGLMPTRVSDVAGPVEQAEVRPQASIAVLPFADMSADQDQDYFADGLAEEILNLLASIEGLKVTGRTSSFSFKGKDTPVPEIGRTLGVAHLLEGSVRKSGDRLRISAQLIEAESGFHLWSETFDRVPADIFEIQDEIAGAIARALEVTLTAETVGTSSLEAYDYYLQARNLIYDRNREELRQARELIDRALALDPDYAPALAASGELWVHLSDRPSAYGDIPSEVADERARQDLERAVALDPDLAEAHAVLGLLAFLGGDYNSAEMRLAQALSINPSLVGANNWQATLLQRAGRAREALAVRQRLSQLEPLFLANRGNLAVAQRSVGDYAAAEQTALTLQAEYPDNSLGWAQMIMSRLHTGQLADAVKASRRSMELGPGQSRNRLYSEMLYYNLGDYERSLELSLGYHEAQALIALGRAEEMLERVQTRVVDSPRNWIAWTGFMEGLVLAGRHQMLLDIVADRWDSAAAMEAEIPKDVRVGETLAPLAIAQRALGRDEAFSETIAVWRQAQDSLVEHGNASSPFRYAQARFHALAGESHLALERLSEAIAMGYRDPLLHHDPAFRDLHEDPEFVVLTERMIELINADRAKLDLPSLPGDSV
jgi:TolB-like protein/tRNA A-37 threonylcarbamoyl transferase component Bud32/Tfp pilus assembly protein PilF